MKCRWVMVAAIALVGVAGRVDAQDPRLARKLDPQTLAAVQVVIDSANAAGLPMEPLVDKALEYVAKGRTPDQVIGQVRKRMDQLLASRRALLPATNIEIIAGADAIAAGVPEGTLAQLRHVRSTAPLLIPVSVLADLIGRGVQLDTASAIVIGLVQQNTRDTDMTKFRQTVERDISLGSLPAAAAATRAEAAGLRDLDSAAPGANNGPVRSPTTVSPKPPVKP